jgi:DNA-binding NtrC family response regulator
MIAVRKSVLVVAQQIELRARIARVLHSAGYGAELAGNQKRALELAARKDIQAAIVVHSTDLVGLGQKLRSKIPTTILVGTEPTRSFRGQMHHWTNRSCSIGSASQRRRQGASAMKLSQRR